MNTPSLNVVLAVGVVVLGGVAFYAAGRVARAARRRRPWHEITARALQLTAVSLLLYSFGSDLVTGETSARPVAVYVAMGLFALVVLYETVTYARRRR